MDQMKTHLHENKNAPSEKIWTYNCDIPHPLVEIICILAWLRLMSDANFTDSYQFLLRVTTIIVYDSFIRVTDYGHPMKAKIKDIWKIGPMGQTKYASAVPKNLGVGVNFRPCSEGYFLSGRP